MKRFIVFVLRVLAGLGLVVLAAIGGLVAMATQPYLPMLLGLGLVVLAVLGAWRLARRFGIVLGGVAVLGLVVIGWSQLAVSTPPFRDASGALVPGSIASIERVPLGGADQVVVLRGRSTANPVLLFLNGGPGGTQLAWHRQYMSALEDHFTVAYWEQRGSGKSAGLALADYAGMTPERFTADGLELVAYLRERFDQQRIYLAGQSWGTMLGVWMAQQRPDWFAAYVGIGQMTSPVEDDRLIYDMVLERARAEGDTAFVRTLEANGRPPYHGVLESMRYAQIFGRSKSYESTLVAQSGPPELPPLVGMTESPEYGIADTVAAYVGAALTFARVYDQLDEVDLERDVTRLDVPAYLAEGRHDLNAMPVLAQRWFDALSAPAKRLVWFDHSGHNPEHEEPAAFVDFMVRTVLGETEGRLARL